MKLPTTLREVPSFVKATWGRGRRAPVAPLERVEPLVRSLGEALAPWGVDARLGPTRTAAAPAKWRGPTPEHYVLSTVFEALAPVLENVHPDLSDAMNELLESVEPGTVAFWVTSDACLTLAWKACAEAGAAVPVAPAPEEIEADPWPAVLAGRAFAALPNPALPLLELWAHGYGVDRANADGVILVPSPRAR